MSISCQTQEVDQISYPEFHNHFRYIRTLIKAQKIDMAISQFDSISQRVSFTPSHYLFSMANACAKEGRCDLAAHYLEKSLINGREYGKGFGRTKTIDSCQEAINATLAKEQSIHEHHFNFTYKEMIDSMIVDDQASRSGEGSSAQLVQNTDSINMIKILNLIENYGFPSDRLIGHNSAMQAFIIILHMDRDTGNIIFKPILDKALQEGKIDPSQYAWIVDRRRYWSERNLEPYYYHIYTETFDQLSIAEVEEINRRRLNIGLGPK